MKSRKFPGNFAVNIWAKNFAWFDNFEVEQLSIGFVLVDQAYYGIIWKNICWNKFQRLEFNKTN